MKFVSLTQLARHAGRTLPAVSRGLRMAGMLPERVPGVHGKRISTKDANKFLERQWPEVRPIGGAISADGTADR